jgi:hypothetical protein
MKMKKISLSLMVGALILSGCSSSEQMNGMYLGGMLGSVFGSSIGGLAGGPRGSDAGTALGMIVGGAVGAAVTAPKTTPRNGDSSDRYDDTYENGRSVDEYNRHSSRPQTGAGSAETYQTVPEDYQNLQIENLRFIDENHNRSLDAGERAKIVFEIRNAGTRTMYNVTPVLSVSDARHILISPTAIISAIEPGKTVRYTAELFGKKKLRRGIADFSLSFADGKKLYTVRRFQLQTAANSI